MQEIYSHCRGLLCRCRTLNFTYKTLKIDMYHLFIVHSCEMIILCQCFTRFVEKSGQRRRFESCNCLRMWVCNIRYETQRILWHFLGKILTTVMNGHFINLIGRWIVDSIVQDLWSNLSEKGMLEWICENR